MRPATVSNFESASVTEDTNVHARHERTLRFTPCRHRIVLLALLIVGLMPWHRVHAEACYYWASNSNGTPLPTPEAVCSSNNSVSTTRFGLTYTNTYQVGALIH